MTMTGTKTRRALFVFILVLAAVWIAYSAQVQPKQVVAAEIVSPLQGYLAPDFTLQDLTGFNYTLSDLRGRVVVLNFWASWCTPCKIEMPAFEKVAASYNLDEVIFLGINVTYQDDAANVLAFINELNLTFPILLDEMGTVSNEYEVYSMPTTYFIDKEGVIQKVILGGPIPEASMRVEISKILDE